MVQQVPGSRLGLGMGSTFCRGYSGTTFIIKPDSACATVVTPCSKQYFYASSPVRRVFYINEWSIVPSTQLALTHLLETIARNTHSHSLMLPRTDSLLFSTNTSSPTLKVTAFQQILAGLMDAHFPWRTTVRWASDPPWLNDKIKRLWARRGEESTPSMAGAPGGINSRG